MKTFSKKPAETSRNQINCDLCGSELNRPKWKKGNIPFVQCSQCGLVFQNPQPSVDELLNRYDDEYFDYEIENRESFFKLMELGLVDVGFFNIEKNFFGTNDKPVFLDIGCATGRLLVHMRERGWAVKGVEVCKEAAAWGIEHDGLDIHAGPLDSAEIESSSVDTVHCSHLIEHLTEPSDFICEVARILKPGGIFVVVTPDISGFQARLFGYNWRSVIDDHMYLFSRKTLTKMLVNGGFEVVDNVSWGGLASGTAPFPIKRAADTLAKRFDFGDVICIMSRLRK